MKSSTGEHYLALDHIRAVAAFMVCSWHFLHGSSGYPLKFGNPGPAFPLAILDEGHTGVALFMTLSGYLFAKLLNNRKINYPAFYWNRFLRLFPLLLIVIAITGIQQFASTRQVGPFMREMIAGFIFPTWPSGGWSIAVELQFYAALPFLLMLARRSPIALACVVPATVAFRFILFQYSAPVAWLSYWTIVGRLDQFTLGIVAFYYCRYMTRRHLLAATFLIGFCLFYWWFDRSGGGVNHALAPSASKIWIFLPFIEGAAYGMLIAYYDTSFAFGSTKISVFAARLGSYSYSIYLLHLFFVLHAARFIDSHVVRISNIYVGIIFSAIFFVSMYPIGYFSFRFIESPFLKHRRRYLRTSEAINSAVMTDTAFASSSTILPRHQPSRVRCET